MRPPLPIVDVYTYHSVSPPNRRPMAEDFARQIESHRGYLLRVAQLQLRDRDAREDVAKNPLLAALPGSEFAGKSSLKTWLTGILKHKIVDAIRRKQREPSVV